MEVNNRSVLAFNALVGGAHLQTFQERKEAHGTLRVILAHSLHRFVGDADARR